MDPYRQHPPAPCGYPPGYAVAPLVYPSPPPPGYVAPPPLGYQVRPYQRTPGERYLINCFCILILALIIGFIVCVIVFTIMMKSNKPLIMVDSLAVSGLNATGSSVSAVWDISMTIRNGNKHLHAYYDEFVVKVTYENEVIGFACIPKFDLDKKNQTTKTVRVAAASSPLDGAKVGKLNREKSQGKVKFEVELKTDAWFRLFDFFSGRIVLFETLCTDLLLGIKPNANDGKMTDGSRKCDVSIQRRMRSWWF